MKVDILAIPPRKSTDDVCCRWRLSMRDESDPGCRMQAFGREGNLLAGCGERVGDARHIYR